MVEVWTPTIDVLVSTFNEEGYVERCLDHVLGQDYPRELTQIYVIDGGSDDGTVEILRRIAATEPRMTVIADGLRRNLPEALNVGIAASSGELVAKIDAHGWPERDFLAKAVEAFRRGGEDVACVGGRPEQQGETGIGSAVALARTSRFGVGGSGYADTAALGEVDTVQCGVYRRAPLVEVGCFDPEMNFGEDEEVNWRLRRRGHRIVLDAAIRFHYITRSSLRGVYRQYRNYGRARVQVVRKHREYLRARHLAPAVLVAMLGVLGLAGLASRRARAALLLAGGAWLLGAGVAAAKAAGRGGGAGLIGRTIACFAALHLGYGIGTISALAPHRRARRKVTDTAEAGSHPRPG